MQAEEFQWIAREGDEALAFWQAYDPAVKVELSCSALRIGAKLVFIDPIPLAQAALAELTTGAQPAGVILTNGNHERAAGAFAGRFGIPVFAPDGAFAELSPGLRATAFHDAPLFDSVLPLPLPGGGPGETALYWPGCGGTLVFGDAAIHLGATGLAFLPDRYCLDAKALRLSAQKRLRFEQPLRILAFAHGLPIVTAARERLEALLG